MNKDVLDALEPFAAIGRVLKNSRGDGRALERLLRMNYVELPKDDEFVRAYEIYTKLEQGEDL